MAKSAYYMVIESFVGTLDGKEVEYQKGEVLEAEDPAFAKWPHLFGPLVIRQSVTRGVEQATAAPGEKRQIRLPGRPRKATAAEEAGIAAAVAAEAKAEPEAAPAGKPLTLGSLKPGG